MNDILSKASDQPTSEMGRSLDRAISLIQAFRTLDATMPTQQMEVYLLVARWPGIPMQELANRTGLSIAAVSRNVAALGKWHRFGREGHDLVEAKEDPRNRRQKLVYLTGRGRRLRDQISKLV